MRAVTARRQAAAFAVALVLLLAQALGLAHRVAHAPAPPGIEGHAHTGAYQDLDGEHAQAPQPDGLAAAFEQHDPGSPECRLIDQAAHGDAAAALFAPLCAFAAGTGSLALPWSSAPCVSASTQPYSARGPPTFLA